MATDRRSVIEGLGLAALAAGLGGARNPMQAAAPDLILHNGRLTTLDRSNPNADAVAITNGRFSAVGSARDIMPTAGANTRLIDLGGRRVTPGLIDSHTHVIRGVLIYNM